MCAKSSAVLLPIAYSIVAAIESARQYTIMQAISLADSTADVDSVHATD